eukprot:7043765-Ditylum_brightwellii.AAC.1
MKTVNKTTLTFYLSHSQGGHGLTGLINTHCHKCAVLAAEFIGQSNDNLKQVDRETPTSIQHHNMKNRNHLLSSVLELADVIYLYKRKKILLHRPFFTHHAKIMQVDANQSVQ